jgi:hypothetical protein
MLEEVVDLFAGLFVGENFDSWLRPRQRRLAARRAADVVAGKEVSISCLVRDLKQPEPIWEYSALVLSVKNVRWIAPDRPAEESIDFAPDQTTVTRVRTMSKTEENSLGRHSLMLYLDVAGDEFEVVIHGYDLQSVNKVFSVPELTDSATS